MNLGFWNDLEKPIIGMAPMADITDMVFRQMLVKYGKPDVIYTEFVSCDGLCSQGKESLLLDLEFSDNERPIIAQVFGSKPENFYKTAKLVDGLGFDGIDINMGCPDKKVIKQKSGSALISDFNLAKEIVLATLDGVKDIPVSVKTRVGFNKDICSEWGNFLAQTGAVAIAIHGRTAKQMYKGLANWESISQMAKEIKKVNKNIIVLGNGDIQTLEQSIMYTKKYNLDGVLIGRAALGKPWFFNKEYITKEFTLLDKLNLILEHGKVFSDIFEDSKKFWVLRKFLFHI